MSTRNDRRRAAVCQSSSAKNKCSSVPKSRKVLSAVALALNCLWKAADCTWLSRSIQNTGYQNVCSRFFVRLWIPWYIRRTRFRLSKKRQHILCSDFFHKRYQSFFCFIFALLFPCVVRAEKLQVRTTEIAQIRTTHLVTCCACHAFVVPLYPVPAQFLT